MGRSSYINWGLFVVSVVLIALSISGQLNSGFIFINSTLSMLIVAFSFLLKEYKLRRLQCVGFFLLFIPLFQLLNFSYSVTQGDTTETRYSGHFNGFGVDPLVFLLLILYLLINKAAIINVLGFGKLDTERDREEKYKRLMNFYYQKFEPYSDNEFIEILKRYDQYPAEAQSAIDKIKSERLS